VQEEIEDQEVDEDTAAADDGEFRRFQGDEDDARARPARKWGACCDTYGRGRCGTALGEVHSHVRNFIRIIPFSRKG
jgi:hypothetical protein